MKKSSIIKTTIIYVVAILLLISSSCLLTFSIKKYNNKINKPTNNITEQKKEEPPKEENYKLSMIMAGDNLIHSSIYKDASKGNNQYDFTKMYDLLKPIVTNYDIAYYNQETILGGKELGVSNYPTFNSPQEVGDAMIDAGFNLVSLATNHTMDRGEAGVINSVNYWKSKKDLAVYSGQWISHEE